MKYFIRWHAVAIIAILMVMVVCVHLFIRRPNGLQSAKQTKPMEGRDEMHLVTVSCGRQSFSGQTDYEKPLKLSLTMMKSAVMFAKKYLFLHIFTEDEMRPMFEEEIRSWPSSVLNRIKYNVYPADYSDQIPNNFVNEWKSWYKPCGSFRLFVPIILKSITDAAIYSDSDVVYIKPIDELWSHLQKMDENHVVAISPTSGNLFNVQRENVNFITDSKGSFQINSGVMLMNFTRMLNADWALFNEDSNNPATDKYGADLLLAYYKKFKDAAEHDQKLLNIMFHFNPDLLYRLPCSWNFKDNFCTDDKNVCEDAEINGAGAVHGISGAFFGDHNPTFKGLYETFRKYKFGDDVHKKLYKRYAAHIATYAANTYCGRKSRIILNPFKKSLSGIQL